MSRAIDHQHLCSAARLALRGHGGAEPNPLVGCVIVAPRNEVVGWGYHRQYGDPPAEAAALQRAGSRANGATLYCTLEPCNHTGKTPPCTEAIIAAKIARVVIARRDPNPVAAGGVNQVRAAGIVVDVIDDCQHAISVSDPFVHRVMTGLPWVTVKWAQTRDGKIANPTGESQWISNEVSRRMVHRERGRVDVILTAIGTVLKDDPRLTARSVRVRRVAQRVIIDPALKIPLESKLVQTARQAPVIVACNQQLLGGDEARQLRERGVELMGFPMNGEELPLQILLRTLVSRLEVTQVLVEAGSGLMTRIFQQRLANEAWTFIAPTPSTRDPCRDRLPAFNIEDVVRDHSLTLVDQRTRGGDRVVRYRAAQ